MSKSQFQVNLERIEFPSDRLTFKHLRQVHPQLFDAVADAGGFFNHLPATELEPLINIERGLAKRAFDSAAGNEIGKVPIDWDEERESLREIYVRYGLAVGAYQAEELIRGFEKSAVEQAKGFEHGPPR